MHHHKSEADDTTKPQRVPRNLLEYIRNNSISDDFILLLGKHHEVLELSLNGIADDLEVKNAIFIIGVNGFTRDLVRASKMCFDIENELRKRRSDLENCRRALQTFSSEELAGALRSFHSDAISYDKHFQFRDFFPKIDNRPMLPLMWFLNDPFKHDKGLSNEDNIFNLISAFRSHDDFFKNYLNVLYSDGKDGEEFSGKPFEVVSSEYEKIRSTIDDILKIIPKPAPDMITKSIDKKRRTLEKTIEKYPATLYLATKRLLLHLENSATTAISL